MCNIIPFPLNKLPFISKIYYSPWPTSAALETVAASNATADLETTLATSMRPLNTGKEALRCCNLRSGWCCELLLLLLWLVLQLDCCRCFGMTKSWVELKWVKGRRRRWRDWLFGPGSTSPSPSDGGTVGSCLRLWRIFWGCCSISVLVVLMPPSKNNENLWGSKLGWQRG